MSARAIDVPRPLELPAESDLRFSLPLYKKKEAAQLVNVTPATFRNWCRDGMVTVVDKTREGFSVPFAGVAEAAMISSLRSLPRSNWYGLSLGLISVHCVKLRSVCFSEVKNVLVLW